MVQKAKKSGIGILVVGIVLIVIFASLGDYFNKNQNVGIQQEKPVPVQTTKKEEPRIISLRVTMTPYVKDRTIIYSIDGDMHLGDSYPGDNPWDTEFTAQPGQLITFHVDRHGVKGLMICWIFQNGKIANFESISDNRSCELKYTIT